MPFIKRSYYGSEDHKSSGLEGGEGSSQVKMLCWLVGEEMLTHHDPARPNDHQVNPRVGPPVCLLRQRASSHVVHLAGVEVMVSIVVVSVYNIATWYVIKKNNCLIKKCTTL